MATSHYVKTTGDHAVLDVRVAFLDGRPLNADEESCYDLPERAEEEASLYQHCVRAILHGQRMGEHGLPLMGSGDWNDGMNLVGILGKGESVWLGFFLHKVLLDFVGLALQHGDADVATHCRQEAARLQRNLDLHGWDGDWYRRAYFDDGTALGSIANSECVIDSIAQSWSVLSGAGVPERSQRAMNALYQRLVRRADGLVQLLDPPFDKSPLNPGYIKGYVPGVRENGGQYTHAAIWAAMAFAVQGDSTRAWELLALINPVNHGISSKGLAVYKAEPYVVAADVYAIAPHTGRGGWTWYTGSASWLYRLMLESLLGLQREGKQLRIAPCIPPHWSGYSLYYRYGSTQYHITITQSISAETAASTLIRLDGVACGKQGILLQDDQLPHRVEVAITRTARDNVRILQDAAK
jgi:cellobiose phosphorylase